MNTSALRFLLHRLKSRPISPLLGVAVFTFLWLLSGSEDKRTPDGPRPLGTTDSLYRNAPSYRYIHNPEGRICGEEPVSLLILVASALTHANRRHAIRESWGSPKVMDGVQGRLVFLLGTAESLPLTTLTDLAAEFATYGDIVRQDFLDTYENLTLKTLAGLHWSASYCPQAGFVMKTDDDIFVNVVGLSRHLLADRRPRTIQGCVKNGPQGAPQPLSASGVQFRPAHPLFTAGAGYVISGDLVKSLVQASHHSRIIRVEDAFVTGYLANKVGNVTRLHNRSFSCGELVARDCDMKKQFTGHKVEPARMKAIQELLHSQQCP